MTPFQHAVADEDRLRIEGVGGAERGRLAESIAEEFRAQTAVVKAACEAEMEQQRAAHKLDLAQQRVTLLEVRVWACKERKARTGGRGGVAVSKNVWLDFPRLTPAFCLTLTLTYTYVVPVCTSLTRGRISFVLVAYLHLSPDVHEPTAVLFREAC